jgi:hypothetical protein
MVFFIVVRIEKKRVRQGVEQLSMDFFATKEHKRNTKDFEEGGAKRRGAAGGSSRREGGGFFSHTKARRHEGAVRGAQKRAAVREK